jgi:phosphopantetheine adenylyltransferase
MIWDIATYQRSKHLNLAWTQPTTLHAICGIISDEIIQAAAQNHSVDNLSVVFVALKKFSDYVE